MPDLESGSPGWNAIDQALKRLYGTQEPRHWGTLVRWRLGGPDPLDGIGAYQAPGHWHLIGYGLSELYQKETDDPKWSGFGFELTLRLARPGGEASPPPWTLVLLQEVARYVYGTGNVLRPGDHLDLGAGSKYPFAGLLAVEDPELGQIETPNGRLRFVQLVGLSALELEVVRRWNGAELASVLRSRSPLLVTDPSAPLVLDDPALAARIEEGVRRDGSSQGTTFSDLLCWAVPEGEGAVARVTVSPRAAADLLRALEHRLPHGRGFVIQGESQQLEVKPGDGGGWEVKGALLEATLSPEIAQQMRAQLRATPGSYRFAGLDRLVLVVEEP